MHENVFENIDPKMSANLSRVGGVVVNGGVCVVQIICILLLSIYF